MELPKVQDRSTNYFKTQNLSRQQFTYDKLVDIGLWPDEILVYLQILRHAYIDFMSVYSFSSNYAVFDEPIREAIEIMKTDLYRNLPRIKYYLTSPNSKPVIPNNYWIVVIDEDNCYMSELEDRIRTTNDAKHYNLYKALEELVDHTPPENDTRFIASGDKPTFGSLCEPSDSIPGETLIRTYLSIYSMKLTYAMVDDTFRNIIISCLEDVPFHANVEQFIHDIIAETDEKVLPHLRIINDRTLYNKYFTLRDLLSYMRWSSACFNTILTRTTNLGKIDADANTNTNTIIPLSTVNPIDLKRVEIVYKYFLGLLIEQHEKAEEIRKGVPIEMMSPRVASSISVPVYSVVKSPRTPRLARSGSTTTNTTSTTSGGSPRDNSPRTITGGSPRTTVTGNSPRTRSVDLEVPDLSFKFIDDISRSNPPKTRSRAPSLSTKIIYKGLNESTDINASINRDTSNLNEIPTNTKSVNSLFFIDLAVTNSPRRPKHQRKFSTDTLLSPTPREDTLGS